MTDTTDLDLELDDRPEIRERLISAPDTEPQLPLPTDPAVPVMTKSAFSNLSPRNKLVGVVALVAALGGGSGVSTILHSVFNDSGTEQAVNALSGDVRELRRTVDDISRKMDRHEGEHDRLQGQRESDRREADARYHSLQREIDRRDN